MLREIELEVLDEGREWTRRRLEQRLQEEADRAGGVFPRSGRKAQHRRKAMLPLRAVVGRVRLAVWRGQDPQTHRWGIPIWEVWGLRPHQRMSPALEDKLVFTATLAGSYEGAAQVADKWGPGG